MSFPNVPRSCAPREPQAANALISSPHAGYPIEQPPVNLDFAARAVLPIYNTQRQVLGSSHFITPQLLATVAHVIDSVDSFFILIHNQSYEISRLPRRVFKDVCLINCTTLKNIATQPFKLGESTGGESVYFFHAARESISKEEGTVFYSPHNALPLSLEFHSKGEPGACGGAIVSSQGDLLGIHNGRTTGWAEYRTGDNYLGMNGVVQNEQLFFNKSSWVVEAMSGAISSPPGEANVERLSFGKILESKGQILKLFMNKTASIRLSMQNNADLVILMNSASITYSGIPFSGLAASDFENCFDAIIEETDDNLIALLGGNREYETTRIDCQNISSRKNGEPFNIQPQIGGHGRRVHSRNGDSKIVKNQSSFGLVLIDEKCLRLNKASLADAMRYFLLLSIVLTYYPDLVTPNEILGRLEGNPKNGGIAKITVKL